MDIKEPKLIMLVGLPGSGKSTIAKEIEDIFGAHTVSRDDIRFSMLKDVENYFEHEKQVFNLYIDLLQHELMAGHNVIADATQLSRAARKEVYIKMRNLYKEIIAVEMLTPLDVCLERNEKRTGLKKVPVDTIIQMSKKRERCGFDEFDRILHVSEFGEIEEIGG